MQKMQVWSLGQEFLLERGMATHSSILAWEIPWTEERGGLQSMGSQRVGHNWARTHVNIATLETFESEGLLEISFWHPLRQGHHLWIKIPGGVGVGWAGKTGAQWSDSGWKEWADSRRVSTFADLKALLAGGSSCHPRGRQQVGKSTWPTLLIFQEHGFPIWETRNATEYKPQGNLRIKTETSKKKKKNVGSPPNALCSASYL